MLPPPNQEADMIVMFTARLLQAGRVGAVPKRVGPGDRQAAGIPARLSRRNIRDEDEVISFGLFDMTEQDYRRWREEEDAQENQRVDRMSAFVQNEYVSGVYEVVDTLEE